MLHLNQAMTTAALRSFLLLALTTGVVLRLHVAPDLASLSIGAPASASAVVLSDNLFTTMEDVEIVAGSRYVTASFSTGALSNLFLNSITLRLQMDVPGLVQLDLYSDLPGVPGTPDAFIASLISPSSFSSTVADTIFGGNPLPLSPNTTYWAVLKDTSGDFAWAWTRELSGSGVGFEGTWGYSDTAGTIWDTFDTEAMQMRVTATPVPGPLPLAAPLFTLAFSRRIRHRIKGATLPSPTAAQRG